MPSVYNLIVWNLLRERLELNGTKLNIYYYYYFFIIIILLLLFLYYFGKYLKFVW